MVVRLSPVISETDLTLIKRSDAIGEVAVIFWPFPAWLTFANIAEKKIWMQIAQLGMLGVGAGFEILALCGGLRVHRAKMP